jgi:hypothetical protein
MPEETGLQKVIAPGKSYSQSRIRIWYKNAEGQQGRMASGKSMRRDHDNNPLRATRIVSLRFATAQYVDIELFFAVCFTATQFS